MDYLRLVAIMRLELLTIKRLRLFGLLLLLLYLDATRLCVFSELGSAGVLLSL